MFRELRQRGLTHTELKILAMISMLLDHLGFAFCPYGSVGYVILRGAGRLAFPIYCYLVTEGYVHTRDWKRYLMDLLIFGLISEVPFDLVSGGTWFYPQGQNVMFTLAFGLLGIAAGEQFRMQGKENLRWLVYVGVCLAGWLLQSDYGMEGVALILAFWLGRDTKERWLWPGIVILAMGGLEIFALTALPLLSLYHGEKGAGGPKYLFYGFYPAHLLLIGLTAMALRGM